MLAFLSSLSSSDYIQILGIVVTSAIGVWIARGIQNNVNQSRCLRDFFIGELSALQEDYRNFTNQIFSGKLSASDIKVTFKSFTTRTTTIDDFIHQNFKVEGTIIKDAHTQLQQELTDHDEFNSQFNSESVVFSSTPKQQFQALHLNLSKAITQRIITVNEAKIKRRKKHTN